MSLTRIELQVALLCFAAVSSSSISELHCGTIVAINRTLGSNVLESILTLCNRVLLIIHMYVGYRTGSPLVTKITILRNL